VSHPKKSSDGNGAIGRNSFEEELERVNRDEPASGELLTRQSGIPSGKSANKCRRKVRKLLIDGRRGGRFSDKTTGGKE